jgi:hypothetical protein
MTKKSYNEKMEYLRRYRQMYEVNLEHSRKGDKLTKEEREKDSLYRYYHEDDTPYYEQMFHYMNEQIVKLHGRRRVEEGCHDTGGSGSLLHL